MFNKSETTTNITSPSEPSITSVADWQYTVKVYTQEQLLTALDDNGAIKIDGNNHKVSKIVNLHPNGTPLFAVEFRKS